MIIKYGPNDYGKFVQDLELDELDSLHKSLCGVGTVGTRFEGSIIAGIIVGRVEIIKRGPEQYTLRDCIDPTSKVHM